MSVIPAARTPYRDHRTRANRRRPSQWNNVELVEGDALVGIVGDYTRRPDVEPWESNPDGWALLLEAVLASAFEDGVAS